MGLMETVIDIPAEHEANVFGQFDVYAKKIERALHVTLIARGESVKIMGDALKVEKAKKVPEMRVSGTFLLSNGFFIISSKPQAFMFNTS